MEVTAAPVAELFRRFGLDQNPVEAARELGVARETVWRWLNERHVPDTDSVPRLLALFRRHDASITAGMVLGLEPLPPAPELDELGQEDGNPDGQKVEVAR